MGGFLGCFPVGVGGEEGEVEGWRSGGGEEVVDCRGKEEGGGRWGEDADWGVVGVVIVLVVGEVLGRVNNSITE